MVILFFSFSFLRLIASEQSFNFDDNMVDRFERNPLDVAFMLRDHFVVFHAKSELEQMNLNQRKEIVHKIGVLGVYFRIHKKLVPVAGGETGYQFAFPEPVLDLDKKLSQVCKEGLAECISEILSTIRLSQPWLYPTRAQGKHEIELSSAVLKDIISDNLLSVEISATQILCFLTLRKNPAFEHLPFCRYQLHDNVSSSTSKKIWPGYLVQKSPTMIDEYSHEPYKCALQSMNQTCWPKQFVQRGVALVRWTGLATLLTQKEVWSGRLDIAAGTNFCPDPCCHGVQSASLLFSSTKCALNKCLHRDRCRIEAAFNDDFQSMRVNKWNITCPCGKGLMYRADVEACVHTDLCNSFQRCPATFDCINTVANPGYKCICQLGYVKNNLGKCTPVNMSSSNWHGFAYSEPHPQFAPKLSVLLCLITAVFIAG